MKSLIVIAGDSGVYVGFAENGIDALTSDGVVTLSPGRHLRTYYVNGRKGSGSAADLAACGIDMLGSSVSGICVLRVTGVRRAFAVAAAAADSFEVPHE